MLLSVLVQDYIQCITHERRLAKKTTVTGYANYLRHLLRWLEENGYPEPTLDAFTVPTLRRFLYFLSGKGLRPRSIRGYFHPIIGLGAYLVENKVLTENPVKSLTMPKKDAAQRLLVTDAEVSQLLAACERQSNPRTVALSRALISVLVFSGLRREELLSLHVGDVTFPDPHDKRREGSILVRSGKGDKSRTVYINDTCLTALREWLAFRPKDCKHDWLWARDRSRRIYECGLVATLEQVKAIAGFADHDNIKPHSLRHNFATRLMENGASIKAIQNALGHAQMGTTAIYLHLSEQQSRQVASLSELTAKPQAQARPEPTRREEARRSRRLAR